jgi:uncharacterized membrane protein
LRLLAQLKSVGKWAYKGLENLGDVEERLWSEPMELKTVFWASHARSLAKAVSWRFFGNLISFIIIYELTHKAKLAFIASGIELVIKIVLYYYHERVWNKVKWGRDDLLPRS